MSVLKFSLTRTVILSLLSSNLLMDLLTMHPTKGGSIAHLFVSKQNRRAEKVG